MQNDKERLVAIIRMLKAVDKKSYESFVKIIMFFYEKSDTN
ncbi:hypothetical protein Q3304_19310 [Clostridioides sp. GD02377]|nr:hypothetical protein [Clostridioides difficile]